MREVITKKNKEFQYPPMELESVFRFGKYKGSRVELVLKIDPYYIRYLFENKISNFMPDIVKNINEYINKYEEKEWQLR